jgi:flagellar biosynthesis/type III secretory pathway protein FliH
MSSYKKILKKSDINNDAGKIYMDEHIYEEENEFIEQNFEIKKQKMEEELKKWREEEIARINENLAEIEKSAYEKGKEKAYAEVFDQVMAENQKNMMKEFEAKVDEARKVYKEANAFLIKTEENMFYKKRKWIEDNEDALSEIMKLSLEKIVGKAVVMESEQIKNILKDTLSESETKNKNIWIRVHPDTKELIEDKKLLEDKIELIPDPLLKESDFIIETDSEWIDATIENKLVVFQKKIKDWIEKNEIFE